MRTTGGVVVVVLSSLLWACSTAAPSTGCSTDQDCTNAAAPKCAPQGRCVACAVDAHCPDFTTCQDNFCVLDCSKPERCPGACGSDAQCSGATPRCVHGTHLWDSHCAACLPQTLAPDGIDNCPSGQHCGDAYTCELSCTVDMDCPSGVCQAHYACQR